MCALRTSARYGRLLKETKRGLVIDRQAVTELERFDGKFVVHSNDDTLTAEDMALGYKQQQRVEEAWRTMKSGLKMRPVFHWAPHRIHAHIAITVLSLLLERTIEHACQDTWRNIRDDLKQIQLALLSSPNGRVWQVTEPSTDAASPSLTHGLKTPYKPEGCVVENSRVALHVLFRTRESSVGAFFRPPGQVSKSERVVDRLELWLGLGRFADKQRAAILLREAGGDSLLH